MTDALATFDTLDSAAALLLGVLLILACGGMAAAWLYVLGRHLWR